MDEVLLIQAHTQQLILAHPSRTFIPKAAHLMCRKNAVKNLSGKQIRACSHVLNKRVKENMFRLRRLARSDRRNLPPGCCGSA